MGEHEALVILLDAYDQAHDILSDAARRARAALDDDHEEPPPPPTGDRQPIQTWMDIRVMGPALDSGDLTKWVGYGFTDFLVGAHNPSDPPINGTFHPDFRAVFNGAAARGARCFNGCRVAGVNPSVVAGYLASGTPEYSFIDCEPYADLGVAEGWWYEISAADARNRGQIIGESIDRLLVYSSSNASWPGSYFDYVKTNATPPVPNSYVGNRFPDFIDGLLAAGCEVEYTDAVFHWGTQTPLDWEEGIAESVRRTTEKWPSVGSSPMLWPDNEEGHGHFPPEDMAVAFEAATRLSTGPVTMFQWSLGYGPQTYPWDEMMRQVQAALI